MRCVKAGAVFDAPLPQAGADEVVVRVRLAGICNTDLELARGYMGFKGIQGHEFVGIVEHGPPEWAGRRVVADINCGCGRCIECSTNFARHCNTRTVLGILGRDGAFASHVVVPLRNLHGVPDNVSDEQAVFVEPLAAAYRIQEQLRLSTSARILVLGDGKLGLLVGLALHRSGHDVTVCGRHADKLAIARAAGVPTTQNSTARYDVVVEATGRSGGLALALALVRPQGTVVLKTTRADHHQVALSPVVIDEITLMGSRCGPFSPALEALRRGQINPLPLVVACYPLEDAAAAFEHAARPGALKVLLDVS